MNNFSIAVCLHDEKVKFNVHETILIDDTIRITATGKNYSGETPTITIIKAAYDENGRLLKMDMDENIVLNTGTNTLNSSFDCSGITGSFDLKVFFWESMTNIKPLSSPFEYTFTKSM